MDADLDPKPARIGPVAEGALLYWPVRRLTQAMVMGAMGVLIALEWVALLLRLE
ncbi:MAG TPA: hypothetical protein VEA79_15310 [Phenylobacterium sp.]|nr:hypothetical protein [Phenylobacterium sp.]